MSRFIKNTVFFFIGSRQYMAGQNQSPFRYLKAYIKFMRLSRND